MRVDAVGLEKARFPTLPQISADTSGDEREVAPAVSDAGGPEIDEARERSVPHDDIGKTQVAMREDSIFVLVPRSGRDELVEQLSRGTSPTWLIEIAFVDESSFHSQPRRLDEALDGRIKRTAAGRKGMKLPTRFRERFDEPREPRPADPGRGVATGELGHEEVGIGRILGEGTYLGHREPAAKPVQAISLPSKAGARGVPGVPPGKLQIVAVVELEDASAGIPRGDSERSCRAHHLRDGFRESRDRFIHRPSVGRLRGKFPGRGNFRDPSRPRESLSATETGFRIRKTRPLQQPPRGIQESVVTFRGLADGRGARLLRSRADSGSNGPNVPFRPNVPLE